MDLISSPSCPSASWLSPWPVPQLVPLGPSDSLFSAHSAQRPCRGHGDIQLFSGIASAVGETGGGARVHQERTNWALSKSTSSWLQDSEA